jgi:hypothetical protein
MVRFCIQAAHEQVNPLDLVNDVIKMEKKALKRASLAIITCLGDIRIRLAVLLGLGLELL